MASFGMSYWTVKGSYLSPYTASEHVGACSKQCLFNMCNCLLLYLNWFLLSSVPHGTLQKRCY